MEWLIIMFLIASRFEEAQWIQQWSHYHILYSEDPIFSMFWSVLNIHRLNNVPHFLFIKEKVAAFFQLNENVTPPLMATICCFIVLANLPFLVDAVMAFSNEKVVLAVSLVCIYLKHFPPKIPSSMCYCNKVRMFG